MSEVCEASEPVKAAPNQSGYEKELYWEDFSSGDIIALGEYFLSQKSLIDFAQQYDPQDFHTDPVKALDSPMGVLCATGIQTMAICQRLLVTNLTNRVAVVAGVHMGNLNFKKPVLADETLRAEVTITETRRLKGGKRGLVSYEQRAYNPRNEAVMSVEATIMVLCRHVDNRRDSHNETESETRETP